MANYRCMIYYPDCPFCGNSNTALSVVDVEVDGFHLKGIRCNNSQCNRFLGLFQDCEKQFDETKENISDIESKVDDLESTIDYISKKN